MTALMLGLLLSVAVALGFVLGRYANRTSDLRADEKQELVALRALVHNLRELAYQHRELDSALSTIFLDEIGKHHRRDLGQ